MYNEIDSTQMSKIISPEDAVIYSLLHQILLDIKAKLRNLKDLFQENIHTIWFIRFNQLSICGKNGNLS